MSQNKQITEDYELQEWLEALDNVINESGSDRASEILSELASKLTASGTIPSFNLTKDLTAGHFNETFVGYLTHYKGNDKDNRRPHFKQAMVRKREHEQRRHT